MRSAYRKAAKRPKIALIDTGYDPESFKENSRANRLGEGHWKDFFDKSMFPIDEDGHGTSMLDLLMKVAPFADICVARIAHSNKDLGGQSVGVSQQRLAEAIEWATDIQKADIVSLSFGWEYEQSTEKRWVANAISKALNTRNQKVLFFASASNFGGGNRELFPARHPGVFAIRSTNHCGKHQDFNPSLPEDTGYNIEGPIQIGNIIRDMKRPQDPIATLIPVPDIVTGSGFGDGKLEHEGHGSLKASLSSKIYDVFGAQAVAGSSSSLRTTYEFDEIEAQYLRKNPTKADAEKLFETDKEIKGALSRGPVFVVTGLKIAKGLKYTNRRTAEQGGSLGAQSRITNEASVGGNLEAERGGEDVENYTVKGDTILAYRLHVIKRESFRWFAERELEVKAVNHGKAGFMNHSEDVEDDGVNISEATAQDAQYFAEEEEYGDVEQLAMQDDQESWTLLSISD
ncbi:hypothetical protein E8E13_006595 [Curvularia kusanoi]|uniref:Peptidase S8/S53 domain-containing protein n=1 Tax=Curvularia kusanoi TaxID=90978 RepID=A0A9P4TCZ5_CURKU|nr:hypothetical protein E8E13_006595 [Curvularia kusanoi]